MKKHMSLILCFLLLSGCAREPGIASAQKPVEEKPVIMPGKTAADELPIRVEESFKTREDLLNFTAAIDPKTYPEDDETLSGLLEPLVSQIQEDGYMLMLESDDGKTIKDPYYKISSNNGQYADYTTVDALIGEVEIGCEVCYPVGREKYVEAGIEAYLAEFHPGFPRSDNWEESGEYLDCYMETIMINGEELPCSVAIPVESAPMVRLFWDGKIVMICPIVQGKVDLSLFEHLTLKKVPLPPKEEAQVWLQEWKLAAQKELEDAIAAEKETALGTPQALKFVPTQAELLTFLATVDEKTYPAEADRGQGLLSPLVGTVRAEGYLLLPYADGAPAEPTEGYCTAYSLHTFAGMSACAVEGFRAGEDNKLYAYFVRYPNAEQAELLKQGIETFKQAQETLTVNLKNWNDSGCFKDYREVTFTLNGEEQTGFATVHDSYTRLEFIYDGKLITLTCYEEGADSFELSLFEHLTLEKVSLPE